MKKENLSLDSIDEIDESAITVRGYRRRTTVPSKIFNKMNLKDKDVLRWILMKDGTILIKKRG